MSEGGRGTSPLNAAPWLAVLGASGRVGTLLRGSGAMPGVLWASRRGGKGVQAWDMLADPPPQVLRGCEVMICLAGAVPGAAPSEHTRLGLAAVAAAAQAGIGHVLIASSIAVYGAEAAPWREEAPTRPRTHYGRAKAEMEVALLNGVRGAGPGRVQVPETGGTALRSRMGEGTPCPPAPWEVPKGAPQQQSGPGGPRICLLRLGNVVGADALSGAIAGSQPLTLDRCPGGGPVRSMIGPVTLGRVLMALATGARSGARLPPVLNIAQPGPLAMAELCAAAGRHFGWRAAGPATLPRAVLDVAALQALLPAPLPPADAAALIGEWRAAGGLG